MAPTIEEISLDEYSVDFFGEGLDVTVTEAPFKIRRWIHSVRFLARRYSSHPLVVGVDVQWTPGGSDPPPDVLQICVRDRCLIIQLNYCKRIPNVLRRFFADRSVTFVGVWNSQDKKKVAMCRHRLEIWRLVDIRHSLLNSLRRCSFEKIVEDGLGYEGVRKDKEISMSDWDASFLSRDQILQAAVDSYVSFKFGVNGRLWQLRP